MSDYISREALFKTVEDYASVHPVMNDNELFALFCSIYAADVRPVVRGKWIDIKDPVYRIECSECGDANYMHSNYCPNCGARMDGEV